MPPARSPAALTPREEGPLKLALPRGALFERDPRRPRRDRRRHERAARRLALAGLRPPSLILVTMRPSDVPTYVEAGAADVGITGKDVLMEQADRVTYELLDLRYGSCRMVLAGRSGEERLAEVERRLGAMRIATKYPRIGGALLRAQRAAPPR